MLIAGNWKMNGGQQALGEVRQLTGLITSKGAEILICPPATLVTQMAQAVAGTGISVGGQDCHPEASGAHTGDIAPELLKDAGAQSVILGHSERRADHGESDSLVQAKTRAAWRAGLRAIVCVGETAQQRSAGLTIAVVTGQLSGSLPGWSGQAALDQVLVIAYEPVWAIGTGLVPSNEDIIAVHAAIRTHLLQAFGPAGKTVKILYGGSVKPDNAQTILHLPEVNGALVGGASLKAADFARIINSV